MRTVNCHGEKRRLLSWQSEIDKVIFKIVEDDNTQAVQLQSGEIDMALLDPKNAQSF